MSQFPVTDKDTTGIINAVNYLLSGPAGLGQNFQGFSDYNLGHVNGNSRSPFTQLNYTYPGYGVVGEYTVVVPDNNGLLVGMNVQGVGIASTATIVSIGMLNADGSIITLSLANTGSVDSLLVFTQQSYPYTYQAPIGLSIAEMLDSRTYKYTFTVPYVGTTTRPVPFTVGQAIVVSGVSDSSYNQTFSPIGVTECTTTYVIARTLNDNTLVANSSGGSVTFSITTNTASTNPAKFNYIHTDCNGLATVNSGTDRVFISAQLNNRVKVSSDTIGTLSILVVVNRYAVTKSTDINSPGYVYTFDKTITGRGLTFPVNVGVTDIPTSNTYTETIIATVIDTPPIGYYWYVVDVAYNGDNSSMQVTQNDLGLRSLSSQVVKQ